MSIPWYITQQILHKEQERSRGGHSGAFLADINTVNPQRERIKVEHFGCSEVIRVNHPYIGLNSWIRVMPEAQGSTIVHTRHDTQLPEVASYFINNPEDRLRDYNGQLNYYRPLEEGEIEISSNGLAQAHFADDGNLTLRGGINTLELDNANLRIHSKTATYNRKGYLSTIDSLTDQERYGVVRREDDFKETVVKKKSRFAKEYLINLHADADTPLFDHRAGDVYDDNGTALKHSDTREELRAVSKFYTDTGSFLLFELDVKGNTTVSLPSEATSGLQIKVPQGDTRIVTSSMIADIANQLSVRTGSSVTISLGDSFRVTSTRDVKIKSKIQIVLDAGPGIIQLSGGQVFINDRPVLNTKDPI